MSTRSRPSLTEGGDVFCNGDFNGLRDRLDTFHMKQYLVYTTIELSFIYSFSLLLMSSHSLTRCL